MGTFFDFIFNTSKNSVKKFKKSKGKFNEGLPDVDFKEWEKNFFKIYTNLKEKRINGKRIVEKNIFKKSFNFSKDFLSFLGDISISFYTISLFTGFQLVVAISNIIKFEFDPELFNDLKNIFVWAPFLDYRGGFFSEVNLPRNPNAVQNNYDNPPIIYLSGEKERVGSNIFVEDKLKKKIDDLRQKIKNRKPNDYIFSDFHPEHFLLTWRTTLRQDNCKLIFGNVSKSSGTAAIYCAYVNSANPSNILAQSEDVKNLHDEIQKDTKEIKNLFEEEIGKNLRQLDIDNRREHYRNKNSLILANNVVKFIEIIIGYRVLKKITNLIRKRPSFVNEAIRELKDKKAGKEIEVFDDSIKLFLQIMSDSGGVFDIYFEIYDYFSEKEFKSNKYIPKNILESWKKKLSKHSKKIYKRAQKRRLIDEKGKDSDWINDSFFLFLKEKIYLEKIQKELISLRNEIKKKGLNNIRFENKLFLKKLKRGFIEETFDKETTKKWEKMIQKLSSEEYKDSKEELITFLNSIINRNEKVLDFYLIPFVFYENVLIFCNLYKQFEKDVISDDNLFEIIYSFLNKSLIEVTKPEKFQSNKYLKRYLKSDSDRFEKNWKHGKDYFFDEDFRISNENKKEKL